MKRKFWCAQSMLEDGCDGSLSSKRVITLLAFIMCSIAFMADLFTNYTVKDAMFDAMIYLVIAGLGFTASEKFTNRYRNNLENTQFEGNNTESDGCQSNRNNI